MQYLSVSNVCIHAHSCTCLYTTTALFDWVVKMQRKIFFTHFLYVHIVDKHTHARSYNFFTFFFLQKSYTSYHTPIPYSISTTRLKYVLYNFFSSMTLLLCLLFFFKHTTNIIHRRTNVCLCCHIFFYNFFFR